VKNEKKSYNISVDKPEGKRSLGDLGIDEDNIKVAEF